MQHSSFVLLFVLLILSNRDDSNRYQGLKLFAEDEDFSDWYGDFSAYSSKAFSCNVERGKTLLKGAECLVKYKRGKEKINAVIIETDSEDEKLGDFLDDICNEFPFVPVHLFLINEEKIEKSEKTGNENPASGKNYSNIYCSWSKKNTSPNDLLKDVVESIFCLQPDIDLINVEKLIYGACINKSLQEDDFKYFQNNIPIQARKQAVSYLRENTKQTDSFELMIHIEYKDREVCEQIRINSEYLTKNEILIRKHLEYLIYEKNNFSMEDMVEEVPAGNHKLKILQSVW